MFKLLIYAVFLYVIYRLLTGGKKKKPVSHGSGHHGAGSGELTAHDELVEDPVCHIYIPKKQAIVLQDANTSVFFCSDQCLKMYLETKTTTRQEHG